MISKKVRSRFAPSPTGYVHVGNFRTMLFEYLCAKTAGGDFLLRVEDTDQTREVPGAVAKLLEIMKWAGIVPDEGVKLDDDNNVIEVGPHGPYTQSKRLPIYKDHAQKLINSGHAYYCFCSEERLTELRNLQTANKQPTKYDGHCRNLSKEEIAQKIAAGESYVIRMRLPENEIITFTDLVRGKVSFNTKESDDQVLMKSDGFPTYHLAAVVDDHLMEITHVIRGEEWLPSTPKHLLLYRYFGWEAPQFAHLSLLLNPDKTKLSKRQGDVSVEDYRKKGYLPWALINFISLLGWNPGTEQEVFSREELTKAFSLDKVNKTGSVFDIKKLDWINGEYIKKLPTAEFIKLAQPYLAAKNISWLDGVSIDKALKIEQDRVTNLSQVGENMSYFSTEPEYDGAILVWKKSTKEQALNNLKLIKDFLINIKNEDWEASKLQELIVAFIAENKLTNGEMLWPLRVALTGLEKSPTPFEIAEVIGQKRAITRIETAITKLN